MEQQERLKAVVVDMFTGEILNEKCSSEIKIITKEEKKKRKENVSKSKISKEFKELQNNICGSFVFFMYKNMDKLSNILNDNDLVKFIYLGTYVNNNGYLTLDTGEYIEKDILKKLLRLKDRAFLDFYKNMINNKLIEEHNNKIHITIEYFYKGNTKHYKELMNKKINTYSRIYINATREMYNKTDLRSFKKLAIVYKLIPYTNWKYNILCYNPEEWNKEKLKVLTIKDVLSINNYNINQLSRFKKDFYSIKYKNKNVFATVQKHKEYVNSLILVNPMLFYKGSNREDLEYLMDIFDIGIKN